MGESPLPPGCRLWLWPKDARNRVKVRGRQGGAESVPYRLEVGNRFVDLTPAQSRTLLFLLTSRGRVFSGYEVADAVYADREDGGPEDSARAIGKLVAEIHKRCKAAGIAIKLKNPLCQQGYGFFSISVAEPPKAVLTRLGLSTSDRRQHSNDIVLEGTECTNRNARGDYPRTSSSTSFHDMS
jgi:hypothetical protein